MTRLESGVQELCLLPTEGIPAPSARLPHTNSTKKLNRKRPPPIDVSHGDILPEAAYIKDTQEQFRQATRSTTKVNPAHVPPLQPWVPLANRENRCYGEFLCTCDETACIQQAAWCECRAVLSKTQRQKMRDLLLKSTPLHCEDVVATPDGSASGM